MEPKRSLRAPLFSAVSLVLVVLAWVLFAPQPLGGQASYVILDGNSMEPGMSRGDLAIVREKRTYEVGDVVTYRHPEIGAVIHRIIAVEDGRFILQGDNNDFIDGHEPTRDEVIGKLWIHVPEVGAWMTRFSSPWYLTGLLVFAFMGMGGAAAAKNARDAQPGRAGRPEQKRATDRGETPMKQLLQNWQDTASVLLVAGLGFGILGWVAFHRPTTHEVPANIAYAQAGTFDYSAASADGRVYDTGEAEAGEPVYRRLSDAVAFTFAWSLETDGSAVVSGTHRLVAEIGDSNGWRRTIELSPETAFTGTEFLAAGVLKLSDVQALTGILEEQSGVKNERYSVVIRPDVNASGAIAGTPFEATFTEPMAMSMDDVQLRLEKPAAEVDPLAPKLSGMVSTLQNEGNAIDLLMLSLPVTAARSIALAGLGLVLALTGWFVMMLVQQSRPRKTADGIAMPSRYRGPLVTVNSAPARRTELVDVASLDDLGGIAERVGGIVLQEARPGYHAYFVRDQDVTYRYQAIGTASAAPRGERGAA